MGIANHGVGFGLTLASQRSVAEHALHLAESGQHDAVAAVSSAIKNAWLQHTVSATNSGLKQTMQTYRPCVQRFCQWAENEYGEGASAMPVSRNAVVAFLEAEKLRRVSRRKRPRVDDDGSEGDGDAVQGGDDDPPPPLFPMMRPPPSERVVARHRCRHRARRAQPRPLVGRRLGHPRPPLWRPSHPLPKTSRRGWGPWC